MKNDIQLYLSFKDIPIPEDKIITFITDGKGAFIIRFCDSSISDYFPDGCINEKSIAPLEPIFNNKSLNIYIPEEYTKVQFSNISSDDISIKQLKSIDGMSNTFILGKEFIPSNNCDLLRCSEYTTDLFDFSLPKEQYVNYALCRDSLQMLIKEERSIQDTGTDKITDYFTFDSFEDFMGIMDIIKRKYAINYITLCGFNDICLDTFNFIEVHTIISRYVEIRVELRLGYKKRDKVVE